MATQIIFTDDEGTVTLANGFAAPADRFRGWQPTPNPVGPIHHALGTQIPYKYVHARSYGAKFDLPYIPNDLQDDCQRLIDHLMTAGAITVYTGDTFGNFYTCYLFPGSQPALSPPDPKDLRRVLSLHVINSEAARMVCVYS